MDACTKIWMTSGLGKGSASLASFECWHCSLADESMEGLRVANHDVWHLVNELPLPDSPTDSPTEPTREATKRKHSKNEREDSKNESSAFEDDGYGGGNCDGGGSDEDAW